MVNPLAVGLDRSIYFFDGSDRRVGALIQYSVDMRDWKMDSTTLESVTGTVRWLDEGPPKTESAPRDTPVRFYRVVRQP